MAGSITHSQIEEGLRSFPSLPLLFEDEVPNTHPVPFVNSWASGRGNLDPQQIDHFHAELSRNPPSSLYVGIPFCRNKCRYCVYRSSPKLELMEHYVLCLGNELEAYRRKGVSFQNIRRIYVGGGTPSLLEVKGIEALFEMLRNHGVSLDQLASFSFELAPASTDQRKIDVLIKHKVSRFSIGVQDLSDEVLAKQERESRNSHIRKALALLRDSKVYFNVDLIYGLPGQTDEAWRNSIGELVRDYRVPEFTLYRIRHGRQSRVSGDEPLISSLDARIRQKMLFSSAVEVLTQGKYDRVRPCHWVSKSYRPQWESYRFAPMSDQHARNEQHPSQLGIGADAISHVDGVLVRNRTAEHYVKYWRVPKSGGQLPDYEACYSLTMADNATRALLQGIEDSNSIRLDKIPEYCSGLKKFLAVDAKLLFDADSATDPEVRKLSGLGLLLYDYVESLIIHECTKFDERVRFSTPGEVLTPEGQFRPPWDAIVAEKLISAAGDTAPPVKIIELGAGVGALSIPVIMQLVQSGKRFEWTGYDKEMDKLRFYAVQLATALERACSKNRVFNWNRADKGEIIVEMNSVESRVVLEQKDVELDWIQWASVAEADISAVFMPSFLNHVVFKRDFLRHAWNRLCPQGVLILGWPYGCWAGMEIGPSWRYDGEGDAGTSDIHEDLWRYIYVGIPSWQNFFGRPLPEWGEGDAESDALRCKLPVPPPEVLCRMAAEDDFSLKWNRYVHIGKQSFAEKHDVISSALAAIVRNERNGNSERKCSAEYIWRFIRKPNEQKLDYNYGKGGFS